MWLSSCPLTRAEVYGNNIGLSEKTAMLVPESKMPDMILGSKLAFTNWVWYLCYIWCLKAVFLCLYSKLTYDHHHHPFPSRARPNNHHRSHQEGH